MAISTLPQDFLSAPGPEITKTYVKWKETPLPEYDGLYAVVLDDVLTAEECNQLTAAAIAQAEGKWEPALINTGNNTQMRYTDVRNNDRIMWDSSDVVARLWQRIAAQVPELQELKNQAKVTGIGPQKRGEVFRFSCLNERMRFLQYGSGEYFKAHCDGIFERPDGSERSYYTLHLYLNEKTEQNPLVGGATSFHNLRMQGEDVDVVPKVGRVLIFQQSGLLHSGQKVDKGIKLTMRTDLMFKKDETLLPEVEREMPGTWKKVKRQYLSRT